MTLLGCADGDLSQSEAAPVVQVPLLPIADPPDAPTAVPTSAPSASAPVVEDTRDDIGATAESDWLTQEVGPPEVPAATEDPLGTASEAPHAEEKSDPAPTPKPAPPVPQPGQPPVASARTICIDPGHGGAEVGAMHYSAPGQAALAEHRVNLDISLWLAEILHADGFRAVLTRNDDGDANRPRIDRTGEGQINSRDDLQARVDICNEAGADLMVSIHNNGSPSGGQSGTEVWYSARRPFSDRNLALARLVQENVLAQLWAFGHPAFDRSIKEDTNFRIWQGRAYGLFVLSPGGQERHPRGTNMPGVLVEGLFMTNDSDAAILASDQGRRTIAQGIRDAIIAYFETYPS